MKKLVSKEVTSSIETNLYAVLIAEKKNSDVVYFCYQLVKHRNFTKRILKASSDIGQLLTEEDFPKYFDLNYCFKTEDEAEKELEKYKKTAKNADLYIVPIPVFFNKTKEIYEEETYSKR